MILMLIQSRCEVTHVDEDFVSAPAVRELQSAAGNDPFEGSFFSHWLITLNCYQFGGECRNVEPQKENTNVKHVYFNLIQ
jgi:hypothetical protein